VAIKLRSIAKNKQDILQMRILELLNNEDAADDTVDERYSIDLSLTLDIESEGDEFDVFGKLVAIKLRSITENKRDNVQMKMLDMLNNEEEEEEEE